jgi:hypothetical protein
MLVGVDGEEDRSDEQRLTAEFERARARIRAIERKFLPPDGDGDSGSGDREPREPSGPTRGPGVALSEGP